MGLLISSNDQHSGATGFIGEKVFPGRSFSVFICPRKEGRCTWPGGTDGQVQTQRGVSGANNFLGVMRRVGVGSRAWTGKGTSHLHHLAMATSTTGYSCQPLPAGPGGPTWQDKFGPLGLLPNPQPRSLINSHQVAGSCRDSSLRARGGRMEGTKDSASPCSSQRP